MRPERVSILPELHLSLRPIEKLPTIPCGPSVGAAGAPNYLVTAVPFCMADPTESLRLNWLKSPAEVMMCLNGDDRECRRNGLCCQTLGDVSHVKYEHWILIKKFEKSLFLWIKSESESGSLVKVSPGQANLKAGGLDSTAAFINQGCARDYLSDMLSDQSQFVLFSIV